ncbi:hypothetical protein EBS67_00125 [bacterium]|nr:hypothetical protein [bacterium]
MSMYDPSIYSDQTGRFTAATNEVGAIPDVSPLSSPPKTIFDQDSTVFCSLTLIDKNGELKLEYQFYVSPESISIEVPSRVAVYQSILGNTYIDHLGQGVSSISLAGTTAFKGKHGIGFGYAQYAILRQIIDLYNEECRAGNARSVRLRLALKFPDSPDYGEWDVTLRNYVLSRNVAQPLLFRYQLTLLCLGKNSQEIGVDIEPRLLQELPLVSADIIRQSQIVSPAPIVAAGSDEKSEPVVIVSSGDGKGPGDVAPPGWYYYSVPDWSSPTFLPARTSTGAAVVYRNNIVKIADFSSDFPTAVTNISLTIPTHVSNNRLIVLFIGPCHGGQVPTVSCTGLQFLQLEDAQAITPWKFMTIPLGYTGYDNGITKVYYAYLPTNETFNATITITFVAGANRYWGSVAGACFAGVDPTNGITKIIRENPKTRHKTPDHNDTGRLKSEFKVPVGTALSTTDVALGYISVNIENTALFNSKVSLNRRYFTDINSSMTWYEVMLQNEKKSYTEYSGYPCPGMTIWHDPRVFTSDPPTLLEDLKPTRSGRSVPSVANGGVFSYYVGGYIFQILKSFWELIDKYFFHEKSNHSNARLITSKFNTLSSFNLDAYNTNLGGLVLANGKSQAISTNAYTFFGKTYIVEKTLEDPWISYEDRVDGPSGPKITQVVKQWTHNSNPDGYHPDVQTNYYRVRTQLCDQDPDDKQYYTKGYLICSTDQKGSMNEGLDPKNLLTFSIRDYWGYHLNGSYVLLKAYNLPSHTPTATPASPLSPTAPSTRATMTPATRALLVKADVLPRNILELIREWINPDHQTGTAPFDQCVDRLKKDNSAILGTYDVFQDLPSNVVIKVAIDDLRAIVPALPPPPVP